MQITPFPHIERCSHHHCGKISSNFHFFVDLGGVHETGRFFLLKQVPIKLWPCNFHQQTRQGLNDSTGCFQVLLWAGYGSHQHLLMAARDESCPSTDVRYTDQVPAQGMRESPPPVGQQLACSFSPWSLPRDSFNQTLIYFVINFNWWLCATAMFYCLF